LKTLIVNLKNYPEAFGERAVEIGREAALAARSARIRTVVCPPHPMISLLARMRGVTVYSQSLDFAKTGASTGALVAEAVKASGAKGTLLNHSEARLSRQTLSRTAKRAREAGLEVCICAKNVSEANAVAELRPDFVAVEPTELIGTGLAVSRVRPDVVRQTAESLRSIGFRGSVLCGAGIVDGADVRAAVSLGAEGVLVSSSVVKAQDRKAKILELARALGDG